KPTMYAARAAAIAASSCTLRPPISMQGRPRAAVVMREPAEATPLSWFRIDSTTVSSSTAFSDVPSIRRTAEPGKDHSRAGAPRRGAREVQLALRVAVHVAGEAVLREMLEGLLLQHPGPAQVAQVRVVEAEVLDRLQHAAGAGEGAVAAPLGEGAGEHLEDAAS